MLGRFSEGQWQGTMDLVRRVPKSHPVEMDLLRIRGKLEAHFISIYLGKMCRTRKIMMSFPRAEGESL